MSPVVTGAAGLWCQLWGINSFISSACPADWALLTSLLSPGSAYYDNVRPLAYPDSDAVLICFDISRPETLDSVLKKVSAQPWPVPGVLCGPPWALWVTMGSLCPRAQSCGLALAGVCAQRLRCCAWSVQNARCFLLRGVNGEAPGSLQHVCGVCVHTNVGTQKCRAFVLFSIKILEGVTDLC